MKGEKNSSVRVLFASISNCSLNQRSSSNDNLLRLPFEKTHANRRMIGSQEMNALNEQLRQMNAIADCVVIYIAWVTLAESFWTVEFDPENGSIVQFKGEENDMSWVG